MAVPAGRTPTKKVVIVDDSSLVRKWLRIVLSKNPQLFVAGEAGTAHEARRVIKSIQPDVVMLDIEMPGMSGLEFLDKLMRLYPVPVVMFSGMTEGDSDATVRALMLGAVDCLQKPRTGNDIKSQDMIAKRVYAAACSRVHKRAALQTIAPQPVVTRQSNREPLVMIGASTGGVAALETVIAGLDPHGPPVIIVQHMPGPYLISFCKLLDHKFQQDIQLAQDGLVLRAGQIVLAPAAGQHTEIMRKNGVWSCRSRDRSDKDLHCPSVHRLFQSGLSDASDIIAVMLTGLGRDGADAMKALHDAGAIGLGQDAQSSTVYGMPRAAWALGAVSKQLSLADMATAINQAAVEHRLNSAISQGL
tara:strand:- start:2171 stop:3250 length:1080 start_codon:yes stop_codon:yes gene_type:complete